MFDQLPLLRSPSQLRSKLKSWRAFGERVALVPVLGPAHDGHLDLVRSARRDGMRVAACLLDGSRDGLVRDLDADAGFLDSAEADAIFAPLTRDFCPEGYRTRVSVGGLADVLCGAVRPGCFDLPSLLLLRLMNQSQADLLLLTEVEWQLGMIMTQLAGDLDLPTRVRIVPALRAEDGLACSAEATALSGRDRRVAGRFASALSEVAREVRAGAAPREACLFVRDALAAQGVQGLDYVEVRHAGTLAPVADCAIAGPARVFGAARIAGLRLVDNVAVA